MNKWFVKKIISVDEAIDVLREYISLKGTDKGYVVLVKYFLALCQKEKNNKNDAFYSPTFSKGNGIRTFKTEGNFKEVIKDLEDWNDDKKEIYSLGQDEYVPCFEIQILTGVLVKPKKEAGHYLYSGNKGIYMFKTAKTLYHSVIMSLKGDKHPNYRLFCRPPKNLQNIRELALDDQVNLVQEYINKHKKYQNKKVVIRYTPEEAIEGFNAKNDDIIILLSRGNFWGCYITDKTINNEEQKPIFLSEIANIYDCTILVYDFEFSWKKKVDCFYSKPPGVVSSILYNPKNNIKEEKTFRSILSFIDYLCFINSDDKKQRTKNVYCIAHNASSVEHIMLMNGISEYISNKNYEIKSTHISSTKIHSFSWGRLKFRDSMMFFPSSLQRFSESMGVINKHDLGENFDWDVADWDNPTQKMLDYAINDSRVLFECVIKFNECLNEILETSNLFYFDKLSLSSVGKSFLLKDNDKELMFNEINMSKYLYTLYHGGRNECFFIGNNNKLKRVSKNYKEDIPKKFLNAIKNPIAHKIDINSSYPSIMRENVPGTFIEQHTFDNKEAVRDYINKNSENRIFLINCLIKHINTKLNTNKHTNPLSKVFEYPPLLGFRDNNKLVFGTYMRDYKFSQIWDFEFSEIYDGVEILENINVLAFKKFNGYSEKIQDLYNKKIKYTNNKPLESTIKVLLNGSYGSLGIKPEREHMYMCKGSKITAFKDKHPIYTEYEGPNGWGVFITKEDCEVNSITQQAAYITAKGRYILWKKICEIKDSGGVPLYCDTDSVIFSGEINKIKNIEPKILGCWKYEGSEKIWEIKGLKIYRFGIDVYCKGIKIPKSDLPKTNKNKFEFKDSYKVDTWFVNRKGYIERKHVLKKLNYTYTKGIKLLSGFVIPKELDLLNYI